MTQNRGDEKLKTIGTKKLERMSVWLLNFLGRLLDLLGLIKKLT